MAWDTAVNILNDAAVELGLYASDLADPYDSTDQAVVQLCRSLKGLGQDLLRKHQWTHLQKTHTFDTVASTANYAMPADFARMLDQTAWNRTDDEPLGGPASAQDWAQLKAVSTVSTEYSFRVYANELYLDPTPSAVDALAYEYQSRYWVQPSGQSAPTSEAPTDGTDTLWFDRRLLVSGLKLYWRRGKGFDTAAAQGEFDDALAHALAADGAAPVLSLSARLANAKLIDGSNIPDTGYGG